jgi:hypothetical protein
MTDSVEQSPREAKSHSDSQEMSLLFMKPEGSLSCWQEPASGPYPEPDESSPYIPMLFF